MPQAPAQAGPRDTAGDLRPLNQAVRRHILPGPPSRDPVQDRGQHVQRRHGCPRCRLYASHALSKFGDRLWAFAIPVLFVRIWPGTFLPAATFSLALYAFSFIFMAYVGGFVDKNDRMRVVRTAIFGQKFCILGSCALMYLILQLGIDTDTLGIPSLRFLP